MVTFTPLSVRFSKTFLAPYIIALFATLVALFIAWVLTPFLGDYAVFISLLPAVVFCALFCGLVPSILNLVLCLFGTEYWFMPHFRSAILSTPSRSVEMFGLLVASGVVIVMGEVRRREIEKMRREQVTLENRVLERTAELDHVNRNLRELSGRLLSLQDEERRRFARELHDSVGQTLVGLGINLSMVRSDIERLSKTVHALAESEDLVQEMSKEVRTISYLLHPPMLDEAGLTSALRWYLEGFTQRSKIQVQSDLPDGFGRLSRELETAIFRVVQECLTNIHRHSGSPTARVRLAYTHGDIVVEVSDCGKGIAPEKKHELETSGTIGVGIRGMRERIRQLGGSLELDSNGKGTMVRLRLPMGSSSEMAAD